MPSFFRPILATLTAALLLSASTFAFQSPLSDEAVREAYFLGQRHDETFAKFLDKYTKHLPLPKSGPHISAVTFLTPFAQVSQRSSRIIANYSAQQAALDHRNQKEIVQITVNILLTESYVPLVVSPADKSSRAPASLIPRPADFWKDFDVEVLDGKNPLDPSSLDGHPDYHCDEGGGCSLYGATITLEFPAESFNASDATVRVSTPGDQHVPATFDLGALR
jgi:hypothetical protein